jgi:hypothetical protein
MVVAALAVVAGITAVCWRVLTFAGFNNDHYIYLAGAQQMRLGGWPIRDFVDPGWPLMYALPAIVHAMFGDALWVEVLLVGAMFGIGAAFTLAGAARLSGSLAVALTVAAFEILINPRSFGYPKIALYAVAGWAIVHVARRPTARRVAGLGLLVACAFLFRHDHGLYIGVGAVTAVAAAALRDGRRAVIARVGVLAGVMAAALAPWAIAVATYVGFVRYITPALRFSRMEAEGTLLRELPRLDPASSPFAHDNAAVCLFYLFQALPLLCLPWALVRARGRERWPGESAAVIGLSVMAIVVNLGFLRSPLLARVPDAVVPASLLLAWLLGRLLDVRGVVPRLVTGAAAVAASAAILVWAGSMADFTGELNRAGVVGRAGSFDKRMDELSRRLARSAPDGNWTPSRNALALQRFFPFVRRCTAPSDRIVMTGLSPDVFVLAERGFGGGQMAFRPNFYAGAEDQRVALKRLAAESVPYFVLALEEERDFRSIEIVAAYLDEHYAPMAMIPVPETRGLQVFVSRARPPVRTDAETGWPCFR